MSTALIILLWNTFFRWFFAWLDAVIVTQICLALLSGYYGREITENTIMFGAILGTISFVIMLMFFRHRLFAPTASEVVAIVKSNPFEGGRWDAGGY